MKNLIVILVACFTLSGFAQSDRSIERDEWILGLGLNTINSLGSKNPFESPSDWAFRNPISISAETRWARLFTLEIGLSFNGFKEGKELDALGPPSDDIFYYAIDTSLKYYFGEYIFPETKWIDFYGAGGLGLFHIEDTNLSFNIGGGALFWLDRTNTYGLKLQGIGKFAVDHSNSGGEYPNNHFQYSVHFLYRF
jgi:hypothetical protein